MENDNKNLVLTPEQHEAICQYLGKMATQDEIIAKQQRELDELKAKFGRVPQRGLPLPGEGFGERDADKGKERKERFGQWIKCVARGGRPLSNTPEWVTKALSSDVTTAGGYIVPDEFLPEIVRIIETNGKMRPIVRHTPMGTDVKNLGTLTAGVTTYWTGQNQTITQSDPTFGQTILTAKKLAALTSSSSELLEDTPIDLANFLATLFGEAFAAEEDRVILRGSVSAGDPFNGVLFTSGVNQVTMGTGLSDFSDVQFSHISELADALTTAATVGARFFFNKNIRRYLRDLRDLNHRPIWQETWAGSPPTLYGFEYVESDQMPGSADTAASTNFIAFGNPSHIWFGDRRAMTIAVSEHVGFKQDEIFWRVTERFGLAAPAPAAAFARLRTAA